ncbi:hypothetical protein G6F42_016674 [Rhizopus arrhizus]|nr:hypothetical protein G6F42_016674 [Rhizopus arrhizus]
MDFVVVFGGVSRRRIYLAKGGCAWLLIYWQDILVQQGIDQCCSSDLDMSAMLMSVRHGFAAAAAAVEHGVPNNKTCRYPCAPSR